MVHRRDTTVRDAWYDRFHAAINMSEEELGTWSLDACVPLARDGDGSINRSLHLMRTKKGRWGGKEVAMAKVVVGFIARTKERPVGRPAAIGCPSEGDIALKNRGFDISKTIYRTPEPETDTAPMRRNGRVRVYENRSQARKMRETFVDRPIEKQERFTFGWPAVMQNVGDSLAVAYASDKWKSKGLDGRREVELYKHLSESRNRALAVPGVIYDYDDHSRPWPVIGPQVSLVSCPMPEHFAVLGYLEEIVIQLYSTGTDRKPGFGRSPDIVHIGVKRAYLGGSYVQWSKVDGDREDEPFIFVYTKSDGVMFVVFGDDLSVEKDGIVG